MEQQLAKIAEYLLLGVGMNATALLGIMAGIWIMGRQLSQQTQAIWLDLRRRHDHIDDDLAEIKRLLREQ